MNNKNNIGLKIKECRNNIKMSQQDLADLVGYRDKTMVSKIERNEVQLSYIKIEQIAKALRVSPIELCGWDQVPNRQLDSSIAYDDVLLLTQYNQLTGKQKAYITMLIECFIHDR